MKHVQKLLPPKMRGSSSFRSKKKSTKAKLRASSLAGIVSSKGDQIPRVGAAVSAQKEIDEIERFSQVSSYFTRKKAGRGELEDIEGLKDLVNLFPALESDKLCSDRQERHTKKIEHDKAMLNIPAKRVSSQQTSRKRMSQIQQMNNGLRGAIASQKIGQIQKGKTARFSIKPNESQAMKIAQSNNFFITEEPQKQDDVSEMLKQNALKDSARKGTLIKIQKMEKDQILNSNDKARLKERQPIDESISSFSLTADRIPINQTIEKSLKKQHDAHLKKIHKRMKDKPAQVQGSEQWRHEQDKRTGKNEEDSEEDGGPDDPFNLVTRNSKNHPILQHFYIHQKEAIANDIKNGVPQHEATSSIAKLDRLKEIYEIYSKKPQSAESNIGSLASGRTRPSTAA